MMMQPKRWWGVRHVRYCFLLWQFNRWWNAFGRLYWLVPNEADLQHLQDVWDGKA